LDEIIELGHGDVPRLHAVRAGRSDDADEVGVGGQLARGDGGDLLDAEAQIAAAAAGRRRRALAVALIAVARPA